MEDPLDLSVQAVSEPNFVDNAFKQNPGGCSLQNFKQWQPVEDFLLKIGKEADDEGTLNGGSSHGSQTVAGSPHRGHYNAGI